MAGYDHEDELIENWNYRPIEDALREKIKQQQKSRQSLKQEIASLKEQLIEMTRQRDNAIAHSNRTLDHLVGTQDTVAKLQEELLNINETLRVLTNEARLAY
jgi:chromosome segregation ATPase